MKTIKKLSMVAIVALLSIGISNAQVGVEAGYTNQKSTVENSEGIGGFYVGAKYGLNIQGPISLQYGLLYNLNMKSQSKTVLGVKTSTSGKMHSLDIPVRIAATFPMQSVNLFVFAGPNFNIGVAGSNTVKTGDITTTVNLYDDKNRSRFDLQLGGGVGVQYQNMGAKLSYDFGLLEQYKGFDAKKNTFKVGVFYNF